MRRIAAVASLTFTEARRNRVTWAIVFFCLAIVLTSFIFQEITIVDLDRIVRDVGLATIHGFGVMLAIFLGVSVVAKEIDRRTVYMLLSKPLSRAEYLVGKILGVWLTIIVSLLLMLGAFCLELAFYRSRFDIVVLQTFWLMLIEFLVLTAFAVFCSAFTSSIMAAFMSASLFIVGHFSRDFYTFGSKSKSLFIRQAGRFLYLAFPNLERLNLKTQAALLVNVPWSTVVSATVYGLTYAVAFFGLGLAVFSLRDLK